MHETMDQFRSAILAEGRTETARSYSIALCQYNDWLASQGLTALQATIQDLRNYQRWLAEEYIAPTGTQLERSTQVTRLAGIKAYYKWLVRKRIIISNVADRLVLPRVRRRITEKDYLTLQEATALLQTQMKTLKQFKEGSYIWAKELEALALIGLAIACGRRRSSLLAVKVEDLNVERSEIRIEHEKGKSGRVMPIAIWANEILKRYLAAARPILNWNAANNWLFVGEKSAQMSPSYFCKLLTRLHLETVRQNPDLEGLASKYLTPHSLRVSFALLLFQGGCNIRSINELMDHKSLSTTALYTPLNLDDLRRVCQKAHPRS